MTVGGNGRMSGAERTLEDLGAPRRRGCDRRRRHRRRGLGRGIAQPRGPGARRRGREPHRGDPGAGSASAPGSESRAGYAYGTDLSESGLAELAEAAVGAARVADEDENSAAPEPSGDRRRDRRAPRRGGGVDRDLRGDRPGKRIEQRGARSRPAGHRRGGGRLRGRGQPTRRSPPPAASRRLRRLGRVLVPAGDGDAGLRGPDRPRLRGRPRTRESSTPMEIGAEAGDEASSMLGATKPESRTCPVVLSERVAASFAGFIGGALCADVVQRGRSPFADRLGRRARLRRPCALADDGIDPAGSPARPSTGRAPRAGERRCSATASCSPTCTTATRRGAAGRPRRATPRAPPTARRPRSAPRT